MAKLGVRRPVAERQKRRRGKNAGECRRQEEDGLLTIERQAHDGRGVTRNAHGKTVFVERALPGERLIPAVHAEHRRYDEAHVRELLATAPERVTPHCRHFGQCGGCDLQHQALSAQQAHRQAVLVEQFAHHDLTLPDVELISCDDDRSGYGYRRRARLGVRVDHEAALYFGFRRRGQDMLFNIEQCPILVPRLEALLLPLRRHLDQLEAPRRVGHVELLQLDDQCCLSIRQLREVPGDIERWRRFAAEHQLALVMNIGRDDMTSHRLDNGAPLQQTLEVGQKREKVTLELSPGDFLQANAAVNQALVDTVLDWSAVTAEELVFDLFAGIGNFSLPLAAAGACVTAVEGRASMVESLRRNAELNGLSQQLTATRADLGEPQVLKDESLSKAGLVVLDPPRHGARSIVSRLAVARPERVIYVSCDPATLARDVRTLVDGGYRIERAAVVDMFPQTAHQESVLLLRRTDRTAI
ncbi:23S rRNA (uracil(1939)-C(5))-methyltransferase RlmD [Kushneria phosphatilytica]|uniref:23S rRNA (Uracil(1939)-C(5))-methyltransferase RlmD n=1 Tax=Kushneria phosphatilytica TaxID=657387 RepID=A0A1S1NWK5_9GAMM|nr:23S rRNA (uracil(1939)-C(5))-methyltransferase RlmD [Kushneria phosphatilytica]OHV12341.1 23S rRNA (uracil-5-)-methyltransferase RumA [Kushneria phosphatilytica]QEL11000.1 23S rRNA (uracil(1939)-C(5))-methyltransferase RlmD [Kushneria phosphatilytica]